jgi:hypothetical protein
VTDTLKPRSFTIRLTLEDQAALEELCALYGLDRPDSLRRAIRQVLAAERITLSLSGYFRPVGVATPDGFLVRMIPKEDHEPAE